MDSLSLSVAFIAGIISFLSPCVLPIVPGFLAYLAGTTSSGVRARFEIFLNSFFFVVGFSLVFAVLGVLLNTVLANVAFTVQEWLARIGGVIIIVFGLYLTGLVRIPLLERTHQFRVGKFRSSYITSLLFGAAFAAGWTPCVGAVLGGILTLAALQPGIAFWLLFSYALGLGIPFLVVGVFTTQADRLIQRYSGVSRYLTIIFGVILIVLGVLAFTQNLSLLFNIGFVNHLLL